MYVKSASQEHRLHLNNAFCIESSLNNSAENTVCKEDN